MKASFDIEKLHTLLRDFYKITRIRITVFDEQFQELIAYPAEIAPYCRVIRETEKGCKACVQSDKNACIIAAQKRRTHVYTCHAGFTEAVTPLYMGGILAGYLLFGHVFSFEDKEAGTAAIQQICRTYRVNQELLKDALADAVPLSEDYIKSASRILHAVASYLILECIATLRSDTQAAKIDKYISAHFAKDISVSSICQEFGIGKTHLYKLTKELYGCGISQHIRHLRMELAKELLSGDEECSITAISEKCGYSDYNYFITVFKREVGCTPGEYRRKKHAHG